MVDTQPTIVPDALIGKTIGNYVVRRPLGHGGMGSVYLAEHPAIGKLIALKVLNPELAVQPEIVTRFFNEAKAVNEIRHPNIVDIIDFGLLPAGGPAEAPIVYFLMEYIDGTSLTELLRREAPLPWARASSIALQIADALAASHRKGIIHRDLKSDNVMLVSRGRDQDFIKLLDFGIAKLVGSPASTHRTRTGMLMGTPQYMSPEQCEGRSSIDHRTDVYSLGILLYQMLTGSVPFGGDTFGEVLMQQMAIPPLAPSLIAPQIGEHVELIVLKALEKAPDRRYGRMEDMIIALQDPRRYVEANGGSAAFLTSPVLRDRARCVDHARRIRRTDERGAGEVGDEPDRQARDRGRHRSGHGGRARGSGSSRSTAGRNTAGRGIAGAVTAERATCASAIAAGSARGRSRSIAIVADGGFGERAQAATTTGCGCTGSATANQRGSQQAVIAQSGSSRAVGNLDRDRIHAPRSSGLRGGRIDGARHHAVRARARAGRPGDRDPARSRRLPAAETNPRSCTRHQAHAHAREGGESGAADRQAAAPHRRARRQR
jgi:hypothetical protein